MELTQEFFNHLLLLLGLMYGFTTLKIALCKPFEEEGEEFSWKKLLRGTLKQLIVISGTLVVYFVGTKCGAELLLVQIGDSKLTIQGAIDVVILAVVSVYAAKYIKYLAEFMGIGDYFKHNNSCGSESNCNNHGKLIGYLYEANECNCCSSCCDDSCIQPVGIDTLCDQTSFNTDNSVCENADELVG